MGLEQQVWSLSDGKRLREVKAPSEKQIEDLLAANIEILDAGWLVIGRQVKTEGGGFIDILCIDQQGALVVVELKRELTPREVTAQALDYASCVSVFTAAQIAETYMAYSRKLGRPETLDKAYDLYNYLLMLMIALTEYAQKRIDAAKAKLAPTKEELYPNRKFVDNKFIAQLEVNKQLVEFIANQKRTWANDQDFIKELYEKIVETDIYKDYMASDDHSYEADRELWRKLYKTYIFNNDSLDQVLEDQSLYWNDDKEIVDTFVLKTIKRFDEKKGANQELLPEFKDDEDQEFARRLFRRTILNSDYYRHLVSENTKNWDLDRIAFMDVIIMQTALAEILSFPNIPVSVSLNEYVEIAKLYSTAKSGSFINGTLDGIVNQLKKEGKLTKN